MTCKPRPTLNMTSRPSYIIYIYTCTLFLFQSVGGFPLNPFIISVLKVTVRLYVIAIVSDRNICIYHNVFCCVMFWSLLPLPPCGESVIDFVAVVFLPDTAAAGKLKDLLFIRHGRVSCHVYHSRQADALVSQPPPLPPLLPPPLPRREAGDF